MSVIYPLWGGDCGGGEDRAEDRGGKGSPPRRNGRGSGRGLSGSGRSHGARCGAVRKRIYRGI